MKSKLSILFALAVISNLHSSDPSTEIPIPPQPEVARETHPSGADELFDDLLELEKQRDPEAVDTLLQDPVEAATIAEEALEESIKEDSRRRPVEGTFIQLSREWADHGEDEWEENLDILQDAGMDTLIIQWTASSSIAYFQPAPEAYTETYPVINNLFKAAEDREVTIILGLHCDPKYWEYIDTRNDVRDVYFRVRNTQNLRLQESLLESFDANPNWTGYYLSEEIDDINWREPADEEIFHQFLLRSGRIIHERDPNRTLSISSFFRKRTAPSTYANNLIDLMSATRVDRLWIQDGIGVEPLSGPLIEPYFATLAASRSVDQLPPIGMVVELFEAVSNPDEQFKAQPALAMRVKNQLKNASRVGGPITVFSLFDYADPRGTDKEKKIFEVLKSWNLEIQESSESSGRSNQESKK